ncbi:DUF4440 domain-containing protein [Piscirickettsia salmonis]|uniref:nuclear transport factor 2 family protein n=1 Tax=Piscirickettsia salmonis TaxID=1238 RepID=UPI0007C8FA73|nr:hypothetical protein A0O36_01792 [Piscirickettsiaceae bacterium NZ-RLO1]
MILSEVLDQLKKREPIFHREEFGRTKSDFENMMDDDFWEVGASGKIYSKEDILKTLEERYSKPFNDIWEASDFKCKQLSNDVYLISYSLLQDNKRLTRRSTVWKYVRSDSWKIVYHQGTVVEGLE